MARRTKIAWVVASTLLGVTLSLAQGRSELDARIEALRADSAHERAMAACEIAELRSGSVERAMPTLLELLGDDTRVEGRLCRDWNRFGDGRSDSTPGMEAAAALERVGAEAVGPLIERLRHSSPVVRDNAARALGRIEDTRALAHLASLLGDDAIRVRAQAAWALGMIEHPSAVPGLSRVIDDADEKVREQAAWALGMIEDPSGVESLTRVLSDASADVREQAAWGLGMIEDGRALEPLLGVLEDEDASVRKQALWAISRVLGDADPETIDTDELAQKLGRAIRQR